MGGHRVTGDVFIRSSQPNESVPSSTKYPSSPTSTYNARNQMKLALVNAVTTYPTFYYSGKNNLPWRSYDTNLDVPCMNVD